MIKRFFKQLFCKHSNLLFIRNIYGDEIIWTGYKRSIFKCDKCGKYKYSEYLWEQ